MEFEHVEKNVDEANNIEENEAEIHVKVEKLDVGLQVIEVIMESQQAKEVNVEELCNLEDNGQQEEVQATKVV